MNLEITEDTLKDITQKPEKIIESIKEVPKKDIPKVPYDWFNKDVKNVEVKEEFIPVKMTREERIALKRELFDDYRNGRITWKDAAEKLQMKKTSFYVSYMNYKNSWFTKV